MQRKFSFSESNISDFTFFITPKQAILHKINTDSLSFILQKGMQTIGVVKQSIPKTNKALKYRFNKNLNTIQFRITNEKNLNYQWSIYQVFGQGNLEQIDSTAFSLNKFWKDYSMQFNHQAHNLSRICKQKQQQKNKQKNLEQWKEITQNSQHKIVSHTIVLKKTNIRLQFQIQAKSSLDFELQQYEKQKEIKRNKAIERFQRAQMRKSTIAINLPQTQDQIDLFRRANTQLRISDEEILNFKQMKKKLSPIQQQSQKGSNKNTAQFHQLPSIDKKIRRTNTNGRNANLDDNQVSLLILSTHKDSNGLKKVQFSSSLQQMPLLISTKKDTSSKDQTLRISSKINTPYQININSNNSHKWTVKSIVLHTLLGLIMIFLMYNLMGHTPKVKNNKAKLYQF